jgi:hypothetical protein
MKFDNAQESGMVKCSTFKEMWIRKIPYNGKCKENVSDLFGNNFRFYINNNNNKKIK